IDDRTLDELIVESQDLQSDAVREAKALLPRAAEIGAQRRGREAGGGEMDGAEIGRLDASRRSVLAGLGIGVGGLAGRGLLAGGFGSLLAGLMASPARADKPLDIQILQTASSLEVLAVATYGAALTLPFIRNGNPVVVKFAQTTMGQHDEHGRAFQALTEALGAPKQDQPNPKFAPVVERTKPMLRSALDVVTLAETLETVATQTYLENTTQLEDTDSKKVMASVMGVESQHAATLRAVKALLAAGAAELVKIPIGPDLGRLPAAAGSVAFPQPFEPVEQIAEPETGAVR
ncbi:MAG TPA: ferritin-like domain-containing protein, partial [Acidimicrobiales bacterium]|nr:ferritin-like domain-containing protein [Acidimicrobiales bacterium]